MKKVLLLMLLAALITGCGTLTGDRSVLEQTGSYPVIKTLIATPAYLAINESTELFCEAEGAVSYSWGAASGTLSGDSGSSVSWTAPSTAGDYPIWVMAIDGTNTNLDSVWVRVAASSSTLTEVPSAPAGVVIDNITDVSARITWEATPSAESYRVYYSTDCCTPNKNRFTTLTNSFILPSLSANTAYWVKVAATNAAGDSIYSTVQIITTEAAETVFPATPAGLSLTGVNETSASLSWTASDRASIYKIGYGTNSAALNAGISYLETNSYNFSGLTANATYYVRVQAINAAGRSSISNLVTFTATTTTTTTTVATTTSTTVAGATTTTAAGATTTTAAGATTTSTNTTTTTGVNGLLFTKTGENADDYFGHSLASVGDVNGDGKPEFIVGAHGSDPGGLDSAGSAYVFSGADGSLLYQISGEVAWDWFGFYVSSAGDVDGDSAYDFIVGAYNADPGGVNGAGKAYVYSGATGTLLYEVSGEAENDAFGQYFSSAGDVNNDGNDDFIICAPSADPGGLSNAGKAYIYSGDTGALLYVISGEAASDYFGENVAPVGDVNSDGNDDFIIAAARADPGGRTSAGKVYLFSGATGSLLFSVSGAAAGDTLGSWIASAGDADGDGIPDFVAAADGADPGGVDSAGSVYILSGVDGSEILQIDGTTADESWRCVDAVGDMNGDSKPEIIVGSYYVNNSVYIFSGLDGSLYKTLTGSASNWYGHTVSSAGDINGDGKSDYIIGERYGAGDKGAVYIHLAQ
ncbi:MAG: fibronectin type III domain-containing protein [bacterium]